MSSIDPIDDPLNYKWGVFYFNKYDVRTIVPKRSRVMGWTFNFARWPVYVFISLAIIIFTYLSA
jgi:uncharacterized membrane protein